ncbi:MAG TPA: DUF3858 domain-containing protein, partial [Polyangiaceae bacterium]|nr:DUF3858 domain-containing protein [Polyangiaceae bacterium]
STRQHPLELGALSSYSETRQIHLPRGWRASELPEGGVAESRFGRVSVSVSRGERHTVTARTQFAIEVDRVSPDDYPAFRRWVEQADQLLRQRILLEAGGDS